MSDNFTHRAPLLPGQAVAVFPYDAASGATLGYYGTVTCVDFDTVRSNPHFPDAWRYWVSVAGRVIDVAGSHVIPAGPSQSEFSQAAGHSLLSLWFLEPPQPDNE